MVLYEWVSAGSNIFPYLFEIYLNNKGYYLDFTIIKKPRDTKKRKESHEIIISF